MVPSLDDISSFATEAVLGTLRERYQAGLFSREIWRKMGSMGMLGLTVSPEYGGSGGSPLELAISVREFTRSGCDLGLALSWITHLALCVKSIELYGTEDQKQRYLPRLVSGEWVGAAAVGEPKTGAHPAGIQTKALETESGFRLDGRKLYITDGPLADVLVVIAAIGGDEVARKDLNAFIVESSAPGFLAKRMDLDFVKTSPHGELAFECVEVGRDSVLGARGEGHSVTSKTAFARERSLVVSAFAGLFEAVARRAADRLIEKAGGFELEGNETYSWIHHMSALEAYRKLSEDLVEAAFVEPERWRRSIDILIYLGISYAKWGLWIGEFAVEKRLGPSFPLDIMLNDMKLVTVGEGFLIKEGRKRYIP